MPVVQHNASDDFWLAFRGLPADIRHRAEKQFVLLKADPRHPSLQFKKIGDRNGHEVWSVRVTLYYRALAIQRPGRFLWFWIGDHEVYNRMIG